MADQLTTREVAARLKTTPSTVNRWANSGALRVAYTFPGARGGRLFDPSDVDTFEQNELDGTRAAFLRGASS